MKKKKNKKNETQSDIPDFDEYEKARKLLALSVKAGKDAKMTDEEIASYSIAHGIYYHSMLIDTQNKVLIQTAIGQAHIRETLQVISDKLSQLTYSIGQPDLPDGMEKPVRSESRSN